VVGREAAGRGTRAVAVVLFTDLVGSTELRTRLGEDAAEELRRKHDTLVAAAIEANRGREVKHLGDGVMATFAGASDAVGAAVSIQRRRRNRRGGRLLRHAGHRGGPAVLGRLRRTGARQ
jgi:class 3 adenylate cyclase